MRHAALTCAASMLVESQTQRTGMPSLVAACTTSARDARETQVLSSTTRVAPDDTSAWRPVNRSRNDPPASSRFSRAYPWVTKSRATVLLPAAGQPHHEYDLAVSN